MGKGKNKDKKEKERDRRERNSWEFSILPIGCFFFEKPEHTVMHHKIYTIYRFVFVQIIWSTLSMIRTMMYEFFTFPSLFFFYSLVFAYHMYMYWYIEGQRVRRESFVPRCKWYFRKVISGRCAEQRRFCSQWCDFSEATRLCQISRFLRGERFTMYEAVEESIKRENSSKALLSRVRAISLSEYYNASCHSFREYFTTVFP